MNLRYAAFGLMLVAGAVLPGKLAAQAPEPAGPDTVVFTPARGKVTFTHGAHAKANACASCHHESKAAKPLASARQKCSACHTDAPAEPMKTTLKLAMHNTATKEGTCFNCHKKEAEAGKQAPTACMDCHKKDE